MAGFTLSNPLGGGGGGGVYRGPVFVPGAQAAGSTPNGAATTLATRAYGITAGPANGGPRTAHYGTVGSSLVAIGLLVFIWWSLPR
jgi:hypothetical protein